MVPHLFKSGVAASCIDVYTPDVPVNYFGKFVVEAVRIPHNVQNCGYKIHFSQNDRLFYATDCSTLDGIECPNYENYFIEANHKRAEIEQRIHDKVKNGEYAYEMSAMRNHLSEEQAYEFLARNAGSNSQYLFLHQHKDYE